MIVHFSTEISGGAGKFVRNLHSAMLGVGIGSVILTREQNTLDGVITLKRISWTKAFLRSHLMNLLSKLRILKGNYCLFGIENCPAKIADLEQILKNYKVKVFIFYWTSFFIDIHTIQKLKDTFPHVKIVFICLDEIHLTGGCHYSHGCRNMGNSCFDCPGTILAWLKTKIHRNFERKKIIMTEINPTVIYPNSKIKNLGTQLGTLTKANSFILPLGAIFDAESKTYENQSGKNGNCNKRQNPNKRTILVRSSSEFRKGCDLFVSALKILKRKARFSTDCIKVISIGDQTLQELGISKYVECHSMGYVDRMTLLELYRDVDALFVCSREDAGPIMINEAVALGLYVLSTPVGVANDLITNNQIGLISQYISAESIAEVLHKYLKTPISKLKSNQLNSNYNASRKFLTFEGFTYQLLKIIVL